MIEMTRYRLSDLYELSSGISTKPAQAGHGYPFCSFSTVFNNSFLPDELPDLMDTSDQERIVYSIKAGDVFLTRTSETVDELGMSSVAVKDYPNATYSGFLKRLRPVSDKAYPKYMAMFFRGAYFRKTVTNKAVMTLRASFNEDIFNDISVVLPPIEVQRFVGELFYDIECHSRNNNAICANLEAMAKLLYDYWFVQFDFPDENGEPYKSSGGKMVWNDELKREIPAGWSVGTLLNNPLCSLLKPGVDVFDTKEYITTGDVNGTSISQGSLIEYETRENRANMQPVVNSVWFAKMKNSIKHMFVDDTFMAVGKQMIFSTGFCGLACEDYSFEYLATYIHSPLFETVKDMNSHGATMAGVNNEDLDNISLLIPSMDVLWMFHEKTQSFFEHISGCLIENRNLASLRDFLLPMLMNGQVKVGA